MKVRYTPRALAEIDRVLNHTRTYSPQGARHVKSRIQAITDLSLSHPRAGQLTSLRPIRRIAVTPHPYLIFYEPTDDEMIIVGVRHGARDPSSMPGTS